MLIITIFVSVLALGAAAMPISTTSGKSAPCLISFSHANVFNTGVSGIVSGDSTVKVGHFDMKQLFKKSDTGTWFSPATQFLVLTCLVRAVDTTSSDAHAYWKKDEEAAEPENKQYWKREDAVDPERKQYWTKSESDLDSEAKQYWKREESVDPERKQYWKKSESTVDPEAKQYWKREESAVDPERKQYWKREESFIDPERKQYWKREEAAVKPEAHQYWKG